MVSKKILEDDLNVVYNHDFCYEEQTRLVECVFDIFFKSWIN